jgi:endonuclease III
MAVTARSGQLCAKAGSERHRIVTLERVAGLRAKDRALLAVERLKPAYPAVSELVHADPFQMLIATILSAQTTDRSVNSVTPILFRKYPDAAALAHANPAAVERIIKPTGFFHVKAKTIIACSAALVERFQGEVPPRMEDLVTLPGVGRKTANVVLGVAFNIPGFAVDTHVIRLTHRLKLTKASDPVKIEAAVTKLIPPPEWTDFSLRLILHGRRVCVARAPRCPECVMNDFCPSSTVRARTSSKFVGRTVAKTRLA